VKQGFTHTKWAKTMDNSEDFGIGEHPDRTSHESPEQENPGQDSIRAFQQSPESRPDETRDNTAHRTSAPATPPNLTSRLRSSRIARLVAGLIAAAFLSVGGLRFWNYLHSYQWTDDAEIDGHLDPISTRINDTVIHVYVENTYQVKAGQPLVDLDPRDYQVAVENAEANLAEAQQGVRAAEQNYRLTVANLAGGIATNEKAQVDVKRFGELFDQGVIAREEYDEIVKVGRVDESNVVSDRALVASTERILDQSEAAVKATQAALDQARLNLSYTHIVAPASGVVGDKTVQVGQRVQPGEQLLTVVPLNDIWITADYRETQLRKMRPGEPVTVHVDTTGRDYKGYIEGMPGATGELFSLLPPENATGNYVKVVQRLPVRIRLYPGEDADHRLRPGMSVEPTVWINKPATLPITTASR
jgi:membrane fusion protein, multidrug efflux system